MKSLYDYDAVEEIKQRLEKLQPTATRQWGKMEVSQMLAHCCAVLELASGARKQPRVFIGRIIAPFVKSSYYNDKPFGRNLPTDNGSVIRNTPDFEQSKKNLIQSIESFHENGPEKCTTHPHDFLGKLTPQQWSIGMYKHLDHHLRQFGA